MAWQIQNRSHFDAKIADFINFVFTVTLDFMEQRLAFLPPLGIKPIDLIYNPDGGPVVLWPLKPEKYEIAISVHGMFPHQVIYQMAHELCHIYIDPRINGAFIEIICHKTAIDILEEFGARFTGQQRVLNYINDVLKAAEKDKNESIDQLSSSEIVKRITTLEASRTLYDRSTNDLIAFKLRELLNNVGKYEIIKHIRDSVTPNPPSDPNDLTTNEITIIDFARLIANIEKENPALSQELRKLVP